MVICDTADIPCQASGDRNNFEVMTSIPIGTLGSVDSLLAATLYQGNADRNKLWNIESTARMESVSYEYIRYRM